MNYESRKKKSQHLERVDETYSMLLKLVLYYIMYTGFPKSNTLNINPAKTRKDRNARIIVNERECFGVYI